MIYKQSAADIENVSCACFGSANLSSEFHHD